MKTIVQVISAVWLLVVTLFCFAYTIASITGHMNAVGVPVVVQIALAIMATVITILAVHIVRQED